MILLTTTCNLCCLYELLFHKNGMSIKFQLQVQCNIHTNHIKSHRIKQEEIRGLGQKYGYKLSSDMAKVAGYKIKNEKIDLPIY